MSSASHTCALPPENAACRERFQRISTRDVAPRHQLDYWMASAYRSVEARPVPGGRVYGRASIYSGTSGQFVHAQSSAFETWLTPRRLQTQLTDEHVAICLIHRGGVQMTGVDGREVAAGEGELFMADCGQPMTARWSEYSSSYLRLQRSQVRQALGYDPARLGQVLVPLSSSGLTPFLAAQMKSLVRHGASLTGEALEQVLKTTVDLALHLVGTQLAPSAGDGQSRSAARLQAAWRYLHEHAGRLDLTPDHVAAALHCSRAQLYRAFEGEALSVRGALREVRLLRSREALAQAGPNDKLADIAFACGFADPSAFGKQFRQRFGHTPGDERQARRQQRRPA